MNEVTKESWNQESDDWYRTYVSEKVLSAIGQDPSRAFPQKVYSMIRESYPDLRGTRVCVPSSGDNIAAFAFHLLGANVTSADLSERQLYNAQRIAQQKGWDIEFICDDSMELGRIKSDQYDLVYTSNGVHVWISDLRPMYRNFNRILRDDGSYIMFEMHPFIRPFDDSQSSITIKKPYEEIGPFGRVRADGSGDLLDGDVPKYYWRVQDLLNAVIDAGFAINHIEEFHCDKEDLGNHNWWYKSLEEAEADGFSKFDWKLNPWAALPQWISFRAQK